MAPSTPRLGLIRVNSDSAQFLGVPGGTPAVLAAMVKAKVTENKPGGESGTTEL
ncbi:pyridoxamine 5'-phosphate oxidase family protein [Brachybacterium huguangmaarense]|uniref:Pyridoxamine 5'-phosphate oxidase family protein n=1 Tax=Brachybacterium huguangmaarense TaxID=1652028 RepID=A0ABY6FY69_9MICO|nr:pyridoxamine 5'-phosphate oxidase family protein [Brachybacterium huguangmaarense]UYG15876.1 pyridoxamine 5'-phosphate oxidase family protein [Brachybacterium huguangmaarense]